MKKTFKELTEGINTFEDVCAKLGEKPEDILPYADPKTKRQFAANDQAKLDYVADYLRQDWTPDWTDHDQQKWYPAFEHNGSSGFGFLSSYYDHWGARTFCGSRLCQKTEELSNFFGKQFLDIHNALLMNDYDTNTNRHPKFKTYQDCEKAVGLSTGLRPTVSHLPAKYQKSITGQFQAIIICEAFNEGWEPDFNNPNQDKYAVCPRIEANEQHPSGFGFLSSVYAYWLTSSPCGSRLLFKSSELAMLALEQFPEIFKDYILFKR